MARQISLIDYPCSNGGEVYEPENSVITSAFISDQLINTLEALEVFEKFYLYEDSSLSDFVEQTRIKPGMIDNALRGVESEFIRLLDSEAVGEIKAIQSDESINALICAFNEITNIHHVLRLKKSNFSNISSAIIKLG